MNASIRRRVIFMALALLLPVVLISCGGGLGTTAGGGTGGTGVGPVTGFGSVIVNGVKYKTGGAVIKVDNTISTESSLRIGMVVTAKGPFDDAGNGTAVEIEYENNIEGKLTGIFDPITNNLEVMGQRVRIDPLTLLDGIDNVAALTLSDTVEVSGQSDDNGVLLATYMVARPSSISFEIKGIVDNSVLTTFQLGRLKINYATAIRVDLPPAGPIDNGAIVMVRGSSGSFIAGTMTFTATVVERRAVSLGSTGTREAIEGFVDNVLSKSATSGDFLLNAPNGTVRVLTDDNTVFQNGSINNALDLASGIKLEVKGTLDSTGRIRATLVSFRKTSNLKVEADVQAIDSVTGAIRMLDNVLVDVTGATQFRDKTGPNPFGIGNIAIGNRLSILGYPDSGGRVVATRVERLNLTSPGSIVMIRGPITSPSPPLTGGDGSFVILRVKINTSPATKFVDSGGAAISRDTFFTSATEGTVVKVRRGLYLGLGSATINAITSLDEIQVEPPL